MFTGFAIGFSAWAVLFSLRFLLGDFQWNGMKPLSESLLAVAVIFVGFGLGSLINDMIVNGLLLYYFKDRMPFIFVMIFAVAVYSLDDIWNEGFSFNNTIFSIALGLSITFAFYKTDSIWVSTGIHLGLNVVYGLFFGISGNAGDGLILFEMNSNTNFLHNWLSTIIAFTMFLFVYLTYRDNQRFQPAIPIVK
ncbi:CPBP family glutamic-type intramembrane protease [Bacillus sp. M6-12]|uniref:CPBP family glutamic-type intramembrane protease n=1 Tax=Bacillus sp. M6-12 TaxID=2054166 RepID=UPI001159BA81|nr:CPBP family glutamic-type intramembrane protease [Bacillus sp. M6-12]